MILSQIEERWLNSTHHYKDGFDFFIEWRNNNKTSPTHLVVYEYLIKNNFDWGDLRDDSIDIQPYFQLNEFNKLYDMDMSIIGIALSQLKMENHIQQYLIEMAKNAISRQLSDKIKKRVTRIRWVKWEESLSKIYDILDNQSNIQLPNKNTEYFYSYFNDKEDE
jgi:hypothetical protein